MNVAGCRFILFKICSKPLCCLDGKPTSNKKKLCKPIQILAPAHPHQCQYNVLHKSTLQLTHGLHAISKAVGDITAFLPGVQPLSHLHLL